MGWSKEQVEAIHSNHTNELVNAGAGSGKTAVLSEHVLYLLKTGEYQIEDFLIVTFTNDAANEMKGRIKQVIAEDSEINYIANRVDAAHIETFDAFALFIVSKYSYLLNLNSNVKILDASINEIKTKNIIKDLIEDAILNNPVKSKIITDTYFKNYDGMVNTIFELIKLSDMTPNPEEFIRTYEDKFLTENFIKSLIESRHKALKDEFIKVDEEAENYLNEYDSKRMHESLMPLITALNSDQFFASLKEISLPAATGKLCDKESLKAFKEEYLDFVTEAKKNCFTNIKDSIKYYLGQKDFAALCIEIALKTKEKIEEFKRSINSFIFNDIVHMCIDLLRMPLVNKEIKETFKYIMVDEYQDTSDLQETIINLIENNNVFMVGDVKQSIYLFRHANCKIFEDKYQAYKKGCGGHKIDMTFNFRSRKEVMDDLNVMFSSIMRKDNNPISYAVDHISTAGNQDYVKNVDKNMKYGIYKLCYDYDKDVNKEPQDVIEAKIVAEDIVHKINSGAKVFDKKLKQLRPCRFSDFAIIIDRGTTFPLYKAIFDRYGIPLFVQNDEDIINERLSLSIISVLKMIKFVNDGDYGEGFKHAYVSLARSFIFKYPDEVIYENLLNSFYKNDEIILGPIREIANESKHYNLKDTIGLIYKKLHLDQKIITLGDVNSNQKVFDDLYSVADNLDAMHYNLDGLVHFYEQMNENELSIKDSAVDETNNSAIILNIHKSKGREFSICYFPSLFHKFKATIFDNPFTMNKGIYQKTLYPSKVTSPTKFLWSEETKMGLFEEKMRLFYVAITRAKEAAIIVSPESSLEHNPLPIYKANNMAAFLEYIPFREDQIIKINQFNNQRVFTHNIDEKYNFELRENKPLIHEEKVVKRASKILSEDVDRDALKYGEHLHYLLEIVDFRTKNTKFIKDIKDKTIIDNVLKNPILDVKEDTIIEHEFAYIDENNQEGIIDCLIIDKDVIKIIDYKLKNIDDEAYNNQLKTYKKQIEKIANGREIKMYLLSIIDSKIREVKDD